MSAVLLMKPAFLKQLRIVDCVTVHEAAISQQQSKSEMHITVLSLLPSDWMIRWRTLLVYLFFKFFMIPWSKCCNFEGEKDNFNSIQWFWQQVWMCSAVVNKQQHTVASDEQFFFQATLHTNILSSKLRFCFCTVLEETLRSWNSEVFRLADEKAKRKFSRYRHVACNHKRNTLLTAFSTKARIFLKCQSLSRRHLKNRPISSGLNVSSSL